MTSTPAPAASNTGDSLGSVPIPTPTPAPADTRIRALPHLDLLESEAVHILREVAGEFDRTALLFSGGKDSIVMLHLALKAFAPQRPPFTLVHVDTGHNFPEVLGYRDRAASQNGLRLEVASVQDYLDDGRLRERPDGTRNPLQTVPLLDAITDGRYGAVLGGARRDEEKARAKERVFSLRDEFGAWDPRRQRPELWHLYNGRHRPGEHVRVFPLSNWTELDVWQYIARERIDLPEIYFAHEREVFRRGGMWLAPGAWGGPKASEPVEKRLVRYRTVGRHVLHRRHGLDRVHRRRSHRRDHRQPNHRTRSKPRRRPHLRSRHGRPQTRGLLLRLRPIHTRTPPTPSRNRRRPLRAFSRQPMVTWSNAVSFDVLVSPGMVVVAWICT